jgi:ribosomal protein S18 acetylase RimI-like enzyme
VIIRPWAPGDTAALKQITVAAFVGVAIDYHIEQKFGVLGNDWQARKARHIDGDVAAHPEGVFVAEEDGVILGYITTRIDPESKLGWIPNIAVRPDLKSRGLGKQLMAYGLNYLKRAGMTHVKIETLAVNEIGSQFYPQMGFEEVVRQIHYVMDLSKQEDSHE